jgi:hypothetical protein
VNGVNIPLFIAIYIWKINEVIEMLPEKNTVMKILINDHRKIFAIREEFNKEFPRLKLEFFAKPSKVGVAAHKIVKSPAKRIGDCRAIHEKGTITITPQMSVSDLEEQFASEYGLSVKVFRKSGRTWVDAGNSAELSLAHHNMLA